MGLVRHRFVGWAKDVYTFMPADDRPRPTAKPPQASPADGPSILPCASTRGDEPGSPLAWNSSDQHSRAVVKCSPQVIASVVAGLVVAFIPPVATCELNNKLPCGQG